MQILSLLLRKHLEYINKLIEEMGKTDSWFCFMVGSGFSNDESVRSRFMKRQ